MEISVESALRGADLSRPIDAIFVNAPLRDYAQRPRVNNFTLPVLGIGYIATYAASRGFNVGVLDAEACGLSISDTVACLNATAPRWVGFNLLAPTYELSARIASELPADVRMLLGGHQAKAMPQQILQDRRFGRAPVLVVGEAETRVAELLKNPESKSALPEVLWPEPILRTPLIGGSSDDAHFLSPPINELPFVDRRFFVDDPFEAVDGHIESNMVGARGCPYNCSFCGAAITANPDVTVRTRDPENLIAEMELLHQQYGVTAFRFVDDLFLGYSRFIRECTTAFSRHDIGSRYVWDATGRINVLYHASDHLLAALRENGCREVALGVESGSDRVLRYIDKHITRAMARTVVARLLEQGIGVKAYFILGFPTETRAEMSETVTFVRELSDLSDALRGRFRASIFEFRPYPGTPEWNRLVSSGRYTLEQLLNYSAIDLTADGLDTAMLERDEFNFSVNLQFGEATVHEVRETLRQLSHEQFRRRRAN